MRQFIIGRDDAFAAFEKRLRRGVCVRFPRQEMPSGSSPSHADVAFEIDPQSGSSRIIIAGRVHCANGPEQLTRWLTRGTIEFASFLELRSWVRSELRAAYAWPARTASPSTVTDLAAVHARLAGKSRDFPRIDADTLHEALLSRVFGQDDALRALATTVALHAARREPSKPAVLFAIGPTGVGKTRAAQELERALCTSSPDGERPSFRFLRLDMNEFTEAHRVSQLLGAPPGYVGHHDGSPLIDTLRAHPRSVILFDEIEKAHPMVLKTLMGMMDQGRLTSPTRSEATDRQIDCRRAVLIFTSNGQAEGILEELERQRGFGDRGVEDEVCRKQLCASGVAPEIVGRVARFLVFRPLDDDARAQIVTQAIVELALEFNVRVARVEPSVVVALMRQSGSRVLGARPDRYIVEEALGGFFAAAAVDAPGGAVAVSGPPFACRLIP